MPSQWPVKCTARLTLEAFHWSHRQCQRNSGAAPYEYRASSVFRESAVCYYAYTYIALKQHCHWDLVLRGSFSGQIMLISEWNLSFVNSKQMIIQSFTVILLFMAGLPVGTSLGELLASLCNNRTTYAPGTKFESNLNTVLDGLVHETSRLGFNTSSYGQSPNKIHGLLQCRGDTSKSDCFSCSQAARAAVRSACRNAIGARVWFDHCYLRYENYSFLSQVDMQGPYFVSWESAVNPDAFDRSALGLLYNLSVKASKDPSHKGFAAGSTLVAPSSVEVYGLVQCWRDLTSAGGCTACLSTAIAGIQSCCSGKAGARALLGSCTVRYETYPFFVSPAPAYSPAKRPAIDGLRPPAVLQATPTEKSSKKLVAILGSVGGGLLALVAISLFAILRKAKPAIHGDEGSRSKSLITTHGLPNDVEAHKILGD